MSDLIDRQALMDVLEITMKCEDCQYKDTIHKGLCTMPSEFENACVAITDAPPAEPKKGKWMKKTDPYGFFDEIPVCSQCGSTTKWREEYKYCPNCGAKMDVET